MFQRIPPAFARQLIENSQPLILDVRDTHSYNQGHITGAVHLNERLLRTLMRQGVCDRPVLVYCYHGNTSQDYAHLLASSGFSEVYSLDGGFTGWITQDEAALVSAADAPIPHPLETP
jgi:thiosulfate sulfurtransferase